MRQSPAVHGENRNASQLPTSSCSNCSPCRDSGRRTVLFLDREVRDQRFSWQHLVATVAPVVRLGKSPERPCAPISGYLCGRAVACRCADRSRVSFTRAQKCSNYREALCPLGPLQTGAAGSRCAQDLGHRRSSAGTPRAHEEK